MRLDKEETKLFYKLTWSLLFYANQKYPIIKGLDSPDFKGHDLSDVAKLHQRIYSKPEIIDLFVSENPFNFNQEELDIIKNWKNFLSDEFIVVTDLKECTIFLSSKKEPKAYGVLGLYDEIEDFFPYLPAIMKTTLLPYKGKIIYNGIFNLYNVQFGGSVRKSIQSDYQKAKSRFGIIMSMDQSVTEKKSSEEGLLKFYLKSKTNRWEYDEEINKILKDNPGLIKLFYQELGKTNARGLRKRLSELGVTKRWFAVFNDVIIASGNNEYKLKEQIAEIIPEYKRDYIYFFKYVKK